MIAWSSCSRRSARARPRPPASSPSATASQRWRRPHRQASCSTRVFRNLFGTLTDNAFLAEPLADIVKVSAPHARRIALLARNEASLMGGDARGVRADLRAWRGDGEAIADDAAFIAASARLKVTIDILDTVAASGERALLFLGDLALRARLAGLLQRRSGRRR